jgi:transcription antitermination factor NusA-like protein
METPICAICAKTGVLCTACETKLEKGQISALDVELSKILYETGLEGAGFDKVIERGEYAIILTKKENIGKIIGKGGENIRSLSKRLGKKIRVIGAENLQDAIHDFIAPARISSINTVYTPEGGKIKRIRINGADRKKLRMDIKEIQNLLSSLTTDRVELSFED